MNNDDHDDSTEWSAVAEECKMSIPEAQEQWNQLLIEYLEYLRNNHDFSLAKHMDFLQPYFFTIIDHQNIDEDELLNVIDSKKIDEINVLELKENKTKQETSCKKEAAEKNIKIEQQTTELEVVASPTKNSQPLSLDEINITSSLMPNNNNNNNNNNTSSFTNLTSMELIFLGYAKQLQRMPLPLQLKTKRKIADIMDEAELEMIS